MNKAKMNKWEKKRIKGREEKVTGEVIWRLVDLSKSPDVKDRLEAANNLCPCHVRRRIDEVWDALYRMLEDEDAGVRRAAFHTLFDGGNLDDPGLGPIFARMLKTETHPKLRKQLEAEMDRRKTEADEREMASQQARMAVGDYPEQARCDFCGENAQVRSDYDTQIPEGGHVRPGRICEACDK